MTNLQFTPEISDELVRAHEQYLVPAIYAQWANRVAEIAEINLGQNVLDVACGTGTLARAVHFETGLAGKVTGLDANEKMPVETRVSRKPCPFVDVALLHSVNSLAA